VAGREEDNSGDLGAELVWWETENLAGGLRALKGSQWQVRASEAEAGGEGARLERRPAASMVGRGSGRPAVVVLMAGAGNSPIFVSRLKHCYFGCAMKDPSYRTRDI
jgi:hypothetical protein